MRRSWLAGMVAIVAIVGPRVARAEPHLAAPVIRPVDGVTRATVSPILYLNRCVGNCVVHRGTTIDAVNLISTIPIGTGPDFTIEAFQSTDDDWNAIVQCMKDVYSPFNVTVTDQLPAAGTYNESLIAGLPSDIGEPSDVLGIAPLTQDCSAQANSFSFTFANAQPAPGFVFGVCWTAAQESAHVYGLDHEYQFTDGASACIDPMTYRTECGVGEKFFRDREAQCGEYATRACHCTATQNSAFQLTNVFGAATPTTTPPVTALVFPATGAIATNGEGVHASATAQRGIATVDMLLNGYPWLTDDGSSYSPTGAQPVDYAFAFPPTVPDGVIDIVARASDDLGISTLSTTVTVTKGSPCTDATTCLTGQLCDSGKCYWTTPTAALGATCAYPQFCESGHCSGSPGVCTQPCTISGSGSDTCPSGYSCDGDTTGASCEITSSGGGCCSAGDRGLGVVTSELGLALIALAHVLRRRRFQ